MTSVSPVPQSAHRLLIADPEADTRLRYGGAFAAHAWDVVEAADGRDALVKALTRTPSLIVSELDLPFIDGVALCGILRTDRVTAEVAIAIVTRDDRRAVAARVLNAGADLVLLKRRDPETIFLECERLVSQSAAPRARGARAIARALRAVEECDQARARRHGMLSHAHTSLFPTTPPLSPPEALRCPTCDGTLAYEHSFVGGVNMQHREQWDYYTCACGQRFQYRQRTRRLKRINQA